MQPCYLEQVVRVTNVFSLLNPFCLLTGGRAAERCLTGCSFQGSSYANAGFERTRGKRGGLCSSVVQGVAKSGVQTCAFSLGRGEHHDKYHLFADQRL